MLHMLWNQDLGFGFGKVCVHSVWVWCVSEHFIYLVRSDIGALPCLSVFGSHFIIYFWTFNDTSQVSVPRVVQVVVHWPGSTQVVGWDIQIQIVTRVNIIQFVILQTLHWQVLERESLSAQCPYKSINHCNLMMMNDLFFVTLMPIFSGY